MISSNFKNIKISGIASVVPSKRENILDRYIGVFGEEAVNKFIKMTGVKSRHVSIEEQTASDLAYEATEKLLTQKEVDKNSIGVLIFVTQTPDYKLPSSAYVLHKRLNLSKDCVVFDVNLGCSGYIYGLQIINSLMSNSNIQRGLLLTADTMNKSIALKDSTSSMLFGDAGAATLIEKVEDNNSNMDISVRSDGEGFKAIIIPGGAYRNNTPKTERVLWGDGNYRSDLDLYMNGTDVFTFTISEVPKLINEFMDYNNKKTIDYDSLILHQANLYILKQIAKRCGFSSDKIPVSMDRYGNTSVASIPITLSDKYGGKKEGNKKILLSGFGVGLSWGVISMEINSEDILPITVSDNYYKDGGIDHG